MAEGTPESIFETADHCPINRRGVACEIARTASGDISAVGIIDDAKGEMVELDPDVAWDLAHAMIAALETRMAQARILN
jgi:hypothetical protein